MSGEKIIIHQVEHCHGKKSLKLFGRKIVIERKVKKNINNCTLHQILSKNSINFIFRAFPKFNKAKLKDPVTKYKSAIPLTCRLFMNLDGSGASCVVLQLSAVEMSALSPIKLN